MEYGVNFTEIFEIDANPLSYEDYFLTNETQKVGYVHHHLSIGGKGNLNINNTSFENVFVSVSISLLNKLNEVRYEAFPLITELNSDFANAFFQAKSAKYQAYITLWAGFATEMMKNPGKFYLIIDNLSISSISPNANESDTEISTELVELVKNAQYDITKSLHFKNGANGRTSAVRFSTILQAKLADNPNLQEIQDKFKGKIFNP